MHLIMKSQFDELRLNDEYEYSTNDRGGKKVVKVYKDGELIAKKLLSNIQCNILALQVLKRYLSKLKAFDHTAAGVGQPFCVSSLARQALNKC